MPAIAAPPRPRPTIEPWHPRWRGAFAELNRQWIEGFFGALEPEDRRVLDDPEGQVLAPGGAIVFAANGHQPVGTGALLALHEREFELAKMAVLPGYQGLGLGRRIAEALLDHARARGARRVELLSQSALPRAVPLYRALGFREIPLGDNPYARANIRMELLL